MDALEDRKCKPCEGGIDPLARDRVERLLPQVPGWRLSRDGRAIRRRFEFSGFNRTLAFINAMAWVANAQDHHPDFTAGYDHCTVLYTTHAIGGLSENDFICAARLNALVESAQ